MGVGLPTVHGGSPQCMSRITVWPNSTCLSLLHRQTRSFLEPTVAGFRVRAGPDHLSPQDPSSLVV